MVLRKCDPFVILVITLTVHSPDQIQTIWHMWLQSITVPLFQNRRVPVPSPETIKI